MNADNSCCCRKVLEKMFEQPKKFVIWLVFIVIFLLLLSLCIGSYAEYEPMAGRMFGIITAVYAIIVGFLLWRRFPLRLR